MTLKTVTTEDDRAGGSEPGFPVSTETSERRPPARPMRADAMKNRVRILEAAEEIFATEGVSVPIDTVAERAGVGVGTVYRHFPTKEALFEAIVVSRLDQLMEMVRIQCASDDPGEALFSFLREFASHAAAKRDLFEALGSAGIDIKSQCSEMIDEMKSNIDQLRGRAVAAGTLRPDVSTDEMVGLIMGACQAGDHSGVDEVGCQRMVTIVCDGLRVPVTSTGV